MIERCLAPGVALLLLAPAVAGAQSLPGPENYHIRGEYTRWSPGLDSQIQKGFGDAEGTLLDLTSDLGVADESTWQARATIRIGQSIKLRGSYVPLDKYKGDTIAKTNFLYGGKQFFAGSQVVTSINGKYYTGEIEWDFRRGEAGFAGLFIGAKVFQVGSIILAPTEGTRVTQDNTVPIPVVGFAGRTYYNRRFSMEGEFSGMTLGSRGHVWEVNLYARINLSDRLAIGGGYHRLSLEGRDDRDSVKLKLNGWQYGIELSL
jgi:hypothetical protein